ncbi:hypothetical protein BpHYR1_037491, partial [Brachionus plicatilis]
MLTHGKSVHCFQAQISSDYYTMVANSSSFMRHYVRVITNRMVNNWNQLTPDSNQTHFRLVLTAIIMQMIAFHLWFIMELNISKIKRYKFYFINKNKAIEKKPSLRFKKIIQQFLEKYHYKIFSNIELCPSKLSLNITQKVEKI